MKKAIALLLILLFLLCACDNAYLENPNQPDEPSVGGEEVEQPDEPSVSGEEVTPDFSQTDEDMFTNRDDNDSVQGGTVISLEGDKISVTGGGVSVSGTAATITAEGTYTVTGTLTNGQLIVDAANTKPQIVLQNASITSDSSAALYIKEADKVIVTLVGENSLSNGGQFTAIDESGIDGAVFSKQDLSFNGDGSLNIASSAGHGIVCKDDLVFTGGTFVISCASHGLDANDSVRIKDANITVAAGKDGIHAENSDDASKGFIYISSGTLDITAEGDGISAGAYLQLEDGSITVLAGGGHENGDKHSSDFYGSPGGMGGGPGKPRSSIQSTDSSATSMKALKAESGILINGGVLSLDSADDAIHSNADLTVNGGAGKIASGDDALHAEDTLTITGGDFEISTCYEGLEALHIYVSGGDIALVATDDGLNAAGGTDQSGGGGRDFMFGGGFSHSGDGSIVISGGRLYINSSGDGIDANGTLEITGGDTTIVGPTTGDTATLDFDVSGTISGGTFIGTGAYTQMAQTFSGGSQGVIAVGLGETASAGTKITLTDKDGTVLVEHSPELNFQVIIFSTPQIQKGESYTLSMGTITQSFTAQ